jgi:hypothetical protein
MPKLLVLGDDLTGSNATEALYARFGLRAVSVTAPLEPDAPCFRTESGVDALVINLGTRHAPPSHAGPVELTVKRVDTTLRGNVGVEKTEAVLASAPETRTGRARVPGRGPGHPRRPRRRGRFSGIRAAKPPARGEASVVTVACLEHLNHVLATGRKNP